MARIITTVSITPEQNLFLMENKTINLSHIVQNQLNILMENAKSPEFLKELQIQNDNLTKNMKHWQQMFYKLKDFSQSKFTETEITNFLTTI